MLRKSLALLLCLFILSGCAPVPEEPTQTASPSTVPETTAVTETTAPPETTVATEPVFDSFALSQSMSTEEMVGQLFLARHPGNEAQALADLQTYHLGGYILFARDFQFQTPDTMRGITAVLQSSSPVPLLIAVDEEGGSVNRISCHSQYRESPFPSPRRLYESGGLSSLLSTEAEKCELLSSLGVNVNMAPVCDISTDPAAFMYSRSLGLSQYRTAQVVSAMVKTMSENGIGSVLKHFPGYGNNTDTHTGIAVDSRPLEALEAEDLFPFRYCIQAGCQAILVSHTIVEALDPTAPASLSAPVIRYLREKMGFEGVVVTDDLVMQAITSTYGTGEAAVLAVEAGCDLLCSSQYPEQYQAVLDAVNSGRVSQERLSEAVARVLTWKYALGLLDAPQI